MKTPFATAAAVFLALSAPAFAEGGPHYLAIHVDQSDAKVMNMALNNAENVEAYYATKGEEVVIEIVTYGPGLLMLVDGKSPVADRIATMSLEHEDMAFTACENTHRRMSERTGSEIQMLDEAKMVPSGAVRLIELQEQGYAYLRP